MTGYKSLALALRGYFHKPLASLPPDIKQRVLDDFAPWRWDGNTPHQRCQLAKQCDYESDPARKEVREGIEALTNPASPEYSLEATKRLRGDSLPEPRKIRRVAADLPTLVWDQSMDSTKELTSMNGKAVPSKPTVNRTTHTTKPARRDTLSPVIEEAQRRCNDPLDTAQVWAQMQTMADSEHAPLLASTGDGLKYHKNGADAFFTRDALNKRLHPGKRGTPKKRR